MANAAKSRSKTKIQPLGDRIVVRPESEEEQTSGGIFLPDNAKEKPSRGFVDSIGEGRLLDDGSRVPLQVKPGDHIIFSKFNMGDTFEVGDEEYLLISENDVLAVIDD